MTSQVKKFVSAQQVAELAGVSRSAVSRTFTEGASVSEKTRHKVMLAAKELGYHVNLLARGLHDSSNIICLLTTDINTPYQAKFIDTLTRFLQSIGKVAMVINTKGDKKSVSKALTQTLHFRAEASIILSGQPSNALIEQCLSNGQRVILVNRTQIHQGAEHIMLDNHSAAEKAFDILRQQGCQRVAVINSNLGSTSLIVREQGFVKAAKAANIDVNVVRYGPTSYESGQEMARILFEEFKPDGVFCVTDLLGCGFLDTARKEFGLKVPEELAIVGFDNIHQSSWESYQLTTFQQPLDDIAKHIIERLQHPVENFPLCSYYPVEPIYRSTTR